MSMSPQNKVSSASALLLQLPIELRHQIYYELFRKRRIGSVNSLNYIYIATQPTFDVDSIFRVNRATYYDVRDYFFDTQVFTVTISETSARQPLTTNTLVELKRGLDALTTILQSVRCLRLIIYKWQNSACATVLQYIIKALQSRDWPLEKLTLEVFTTHHVKGTDDFFLTCCPDKMTFRVSVETAAMIPHEELIIEDHKQIQPSTKKALLNLLTVDPNLGKQVQPDYGETALLEQIMGYYYTANWHPDPTIKGYYTSDIRDCRRICGKPGMRPWNFPRRIKRWLLGTPTHFENKSVLESVTLIELKKAAVPRHITHEGGRGRVPVSEPKATTLRRPRL